MTVVVTAMWMTEPWHFWLSLACSCDSNSGGCTDNSALALSAIPAHLLIDDDGSGSIVDNGALVLTTVPHSLM
jgi:hypothetical protein